MDQQQHRIGGNECKRSYFRSSKRSLNIERMALASSKGIFISEDGGENWEQKTTSLVYKVGFSTETVGAMVASTNSSQVSEFMLHYSTDNGETWETISNDQLLAIGSGSSQYVFDDNSVTVYIGSFDLGLVEYTIDLSVMGAPEFGNGDDAIAIYPNPTSAELNISLKNSNVKEVAIYSLSGAKVLDVADVSNINISQLVAGMYLVRVMDNNNAVFFKRILKQ